MHSFVQVMSSKRSDAFSKLFTPTADIGERIVTTEVGKHFDLHPKRSIRMDVRREIIETNIIYRGGGKS